ncbi:MAG: hypothetical protein CMJ39_07185 [Phycisphaerae bacterium]|nr:hypothetical protein [Phycisphaerae bacterium]
MSTTASTSATSITGACRFSLNLTMMLVKDIDPEKFADRCGTTINHPAFILGHLAYYMGVCMQLMGGEIELSDSDTERYQHGVECHDNPSLYPDKDEAIAQFTQRLNTVCDFLDSCDDAVFAKSSAGTFFEERMPTMGAIATFMMVGHVNLHLGQVSAWRRVAGMGPAS